MTGPTETAPRERQRFGIQESPPKKAVKIAVSFMAVVATTTTCREGYKMIQGSYNEIICLLNFFTGIVGTHPQGFGLE